MSDSTVTEAVLSQIGEDIYQTAQEKGFWIPSSEFTQQINTKLMLIVSEVAEAMEAFREDRDHLTALPEFLEELADVVIRTFDLARHLSPSFGQVILAKVEKNRDRPYKHDKRF